MLYLIPPFYYLLSGVVVLYISDRWLKRQKLPLPPGPKRYPIIGGLFSFPKDHSWVHLAEHKDLYGPISSTSVFSQKFVFLNDRETTYDLLDERSAIYSDRPDLPFATLCGITYNMSLLHYDNEYKYQRKIVQQSFSTNNAVLRMRPVVEAAMRRFLLHTVKEPSNLHKHIRTAAGAIILKVTYGYSIETNEQDPLVHEVEEAMKLTMLALEPATWIVDLLPFMRHIPEWLPGSGFKRTARKWGRVLDEFVERPYQFVKQQMAAGVAEPSYTSTVIEQARDGPSRSEEFAFKRSASTMYGAGSDTTLSTIQSFFLAMVIYPEVQKKAQAELDAVIGPDRLPTISDRDNLPYVTAVFKETLRWHTVVPLGLPHVVMEDDAYRGYLIPKGSIILPNIWLFNHDPNNYRDPFSFQPERFLGDSPEHDPSNTIFGFGRRLCAGKRLAELSVFTAIAMSLATFKVDKARDADGFEITPVYRSDECSDEIISHPKPFSCNVEPRSAKARELVMSAENEYDFSHSDAEVLRMITLGDDAGY